MENEEKSEEKTSGTVKVITELAKTIPVYQDVAQPAAQEVGKSLQIIAKTVNIALSPIKALVWSYEKLEQFINKEVSAKLENTSDANIQTPKANIAVPILQALTYSEDEPELQDLFANLLACSMDKGTSMYAHPSYVEAIKQMTPDEAKLMSFFSVNTTFPIITIKLVNKDNRGETDYARHVTLIGTLAKCDNPNLIPVYIDNLIRLGFIKIPNMVSYLDKTLYSDLKKSEQVIEMIKSIYDQDKRARIIEQTIAITDIGRNFIQTCVIDHRKIME